jgi:hypothetical protein
VVVQAEKLKKPWKEKVKKPRVPSPKSGLFFGHSKEKEK